MPAALVTSSGSSTSTTVYREFTRIGGGKVPDDKTMGRLARQLGPEPVEKLHQRLVAIAQDKKIVPGRKRSVNLRVMEIARASRSKSEQGRERMKGLYEKLLTATAAVAGQA